MRIQSEAGYSSIALRDYQNAGEVKMENGHVSFSTVFSEQTHQAMKSKDSTENAKDDEKLDFTHMTPSKLHETVGWLTRTGQMDLDESSALVGMMNPSSPLLKVNYDGLPLDYSETPVDFIEKVKNSIDAARLRNEQSSVEGLQRAALALSRFQGSAPPRVDFSV